VRDLDWDGCFAIRDLGGFTTPAGVTASRVFVRGDNARNLTARGWEQALRYGIRTVLDLRSPPECRSDAPLPTGVAYECVSLFAHFDEDAAYRADLLGRVAGHSVASQYQTLYAEALDLDRRKFAKAFDVLSVRPAPILFHCVGGKDRTGVLAALLLRLAGVSLQDAEADYIHTETRAQGRTTAPHIDNSAPSGVIEQVVTHLERRYGNVANYLLDSGVSTNRVRALVEKFLARSAA
jgi:protein-tyrosine phosphatase